MTKTLKDTLKEIQILLGKPHKKIAEAFKYYLNFLNPAENGEKEKALPHKTEKLQVLQHDKITWVDVIDPTRREIAELAQKYPFHPLHLEDCISKSQFPKIEQSDEDKYLFFLFRFPHLQEREGNITTRQFCFFLGKDYLVTIHENSDNIISNIFDSCKENPRQRQAYINNSPSHLLYTIIEQLTDELSPLLKKILMEVDKAEDIVFDDKVSGVYQIGQLRRKLISLRRVIGPLRGLLKDIQEKINKFTRRNLTVYFVDLSHRIDRAWETLEEARETVDIYKDADFISSTEKTNSILSVLTILFTFTLPATVIGTFFGMNILLPGGIEAGSWTFFGKYTAFIVILIAAAVPALLMHLYFRKRGWF